MSTFDMADWGTDSTIDSRDIIEAQETLQAERDDLSEAVDDAETAYNGDPDESTLQALDNARLALSEWDADNADSLAALSSICADGENHSDWSHGETLILESYFVEYIEELIRDCYSLPNEMKSNAWPWRHISIDYEAAADEAKDDYAEITHDGTTYYIRSC